MITLKSQISLYQFIRSLFELKSHKFDGWYELYCDVKISHVTENNIHIKVDFDHGS